MVTQRSVSYNSINILVSYWSILCVPVSLSSMHSRVSGGVEMIGRQRRPFTGQYVPCGRAVRKLGHIKFKSQFSALQYYIMVNRSVCIILHALIVYGDSKLRTHKHGTNHSHPPHVAFIKICGSDI